MNLTSDVVTLVLLYYVHFGIFKEVMPTSLHSCDPQPDNIHVCMTYVVM